MKNDLRIPLDRIPDEGLDVNFEIPSEDLEVEEEDFPPLSGLRLTGRLERLGALEAVFRGRVTFEFTVECSLGLAQFQLPINEEMTVFFEAPPEGGVALEGEIECKERDLEVYYLQNSDIVNLLSPLRDQVYLATPLQPKCPEKCLGENPEICERLERGEGVGTEESMDPRWAALKEWGQAKQ